MTSTLSRRKFALAGLLCAGALFLLRSYQQINARDHGFNPAGALTFQITVPVGKDTKPGAISRLYDDILTRIRQIPTVTAAGATTNLPWSGYDENTSFFIVGRPANDDGVSARPQAATPGYFEAVGMRSSNGRFFNPVLDATGKPGTLLVNDAMAARYFPKGKAVGSPIKFVAAMKIAEPDPIIGVVAGVKIAGRS